MRRNHNHRQLAIPSGQTLSGVLWALQPDAPLPNLAGFDRLVGTPPDTLARLNEWIEPQATCDAILKHHGPDGLSRVLRGIAQASSAARVPMGHRVQGYAGAAGIPVV